MQQKFSGLLVVFVILCRMAKMVARPLNVRTRILFDVPLGNRIYGLDLPASSVNWGMRVAMAGVSPPRRFLLW